MATALAKGIVEAGLVSAENLSASDPMADARRKFTEATGGNTSDDNRTIVADSDVIFLAVKPYQLAAVADLLRAEVGTKKLLVSIVAGIRLPKLAEWFGDQTRLIRVMPNTPCLVQQGACGFCLGPNATDDDAKLVKRLLDSVGLAVEVDEKMLDVVTGLSGSGPAFVYTIIEALSDGAVRMGLPRAVATALAAQTVRGAAEMVLTTGRHTGELKDQVTSPGGTTIAGIHALESAGVRAALMNAVEAATSKSIELGKME